MGVQKSMRITDYLGDGLGQLPLNIMSCLVGQLTYFYTEKVGLAAGMVATMLLIAKIFDAFSDLAMGKIMDNGKSPKGKCRPWFSRMAIPAFVSIILLFTVPKNMGGGLQAKICTDHKRTDYSNCIHSSSNSLQCFDGNPYRKF